MNHPPDPSDADLSPPDPAQPGPDPGSAHGQIQHLVAIGSSAGGLDALQDLLSCLVDEGAVAYVVAQHLAAEHRSLIVPLLSHVTSLRVVAAVDGRRLEPGLIVVAPPNRDVSVEGDRLRVSEPTPRFGPSPSVDLLFDSVAQHWGERGVAVVLSGTGSDGSRGLRAVRAAGGLTLVQSPESARFDGMPRAAIGLGGAELVLPAQQIGQRLAALASLGHASDWSGQTLPEPEPVMLQSVSSQLRQAIGIDFSLYKESTLRRQVRRRMAIRQVREIGDYLALLASEPEEAHALSQNLLVTVTAFFRDPEVFEALGAALQKRLQGLPPRQPLRVWVPGCATGEEVYSIAMVVSGLLDHPPDLSTRLKIFGTDLDEISLAIARRAVYPASAAREIPEALQQRFVHTRDDGEIEISEVLRECVVFARHKRGRGPSLPPAGSDLLPQHAHLLHDSSA